ncbi:unnamed protein product, partial [Amoebophrya sp. A25]
RLVWLQRRPCAKNLRAVRSGILLRLIRYRERHKIPRLLLQPLAVLSRHLMFIQRRLPEYNTRWRWPVMHRGRSFLRKFQRS